MVFYLKVNRTERYSFINIQHWIDSIFLLPEPIVYFVCDNSELQRDILRHIDMHGKDVYFLNSNKETEKINHIISNITDNAWRNAGYAHITTFWHAKENQYPFFWNIDADDTYMCLDPVRIAEAFEMVEKSARQEGIHIYSLDMWRSNLMTYKGIENWSFGITYTDNSVDWLSVMEQHCEDDLYQLGDLELLIDDYFTYLKRVTSLKIETFYFENLKFIHYSDNLFEKATRSGFCHWEKGRLKYPILENCYGLVLNSDIPIASDVRKLDMKIKDCEGMNALLAGTGSADKSRFLKEDYVREELSEMTELLKKRNKLYVSIRIGGEYSMNAGGDIENAEIVCWGAGMCLAKNYKRIKAFYDLKYVCDIDANKWGKKIIDNVTCISPQELLKLKNVIVVIAVEDTILAFDIAKMIVELGITQFEYIYSWLDYVEGRRRI